MPIKNPALRSTACDFVRVEGGSPDPEALTRTAIGALESGLYRIDRSFGSFECESRSPVHLEHRDGPANNVSIEIETGRRVYEPLGIDAVAFALAVLRAPRLSDDLRSDVETVMRDAGRNVEEAVRPSTRKVSIWVHAPLGALPATNSIGNGLFHQDPPLDPTLLVLPSIALLGVQEAHDEEEDDTGGVVHVPARITIGRLRAFPGGDPDDTITVLRRLTRVREARDAPFADRTATVIRASART